MAAKRNDLRAELSRFERRLRDAWSMEVPCVPQHLQAYRQEWLNTLEQPSTEATSEEMYRAIRKADLILVSDFHPLRRSRTGLAEIIRQLPDDRGIILGLELLPHGTTLTVGEALRSADIQLVTGQTLLEAYAPALQALSQHRATIVGTWVDGNAHRRDEAAAKIWARIHRKPGRFRGIFHFGDWHLAADHLPARMEEIGTSPIVIHQSPEPIWERAGIAPSGNVFRIGEKHWAWLQTPPLGLWANHLQDLSKYEEENAGEAAEHLCESASEYLAETLRISAPSCRLTVVLKSGWQEFHRHLPRHLQTAFHLDAPPTIPVFHPRLPLMWSPGPPDLTHLIEGAAHCLNCSSSLHLEVGFKPELRRQVFRHLCAHLVNPFLAESSLKSLSEQLLPPAIAKQTCAKIDAISQSPNLWIGLTDTEEMLLLAYVGRLAGRKMAANRDLELKNLQQFPEAGTRGFDWDALMATILAA